jgi:hypothetical protein
MQFSKEIKSLKVEQREKYFCLKLPPLVYGIYSLYILYSVYCIHTTHPHGKDFMFAFTADRGNHKEFTAVGTIG